MRQFKHRCHWRDFIVQDIFVQEKWLKWIQNVIVGQISLLKAIIWPKTANFHLLYSYHIFKGESCLRSWRRLVEEHILNYKSFFKFFVNKKKRARQKSLPIQQHLHFRVIILYAVHTMQWRCSRHHTPRLRARSMLCDCFRIRRLSHRECVIFEWIMLFMRCGKCKENKTII